MNTQQKQLILIFVFLFALSFIIINWNDVSWLFNYRVVNSLVYDFFYPYENNGNLVSANNVTINTGVVRAIEVTSNFPVVTQQPKMYPYSAKLNSIEIPTIGIVAPVVIGESTDLGLLEKNLNQGTVVYPGSVSPGENGQTIILGHSAPPNWPKIKYDWVFSEINNLNFGDEIVLYSNNRQYTYRVIQKDIVKAGGDIPVNTLTGKNNVLVLVSCWPPGKNYKRITVSAELINN